MKVGRRELDGREQEVVQKLEQAFSMGCTDVEACLYADISNTTLFNYQNRHPEFAKRKEELKNKPILKARTEVIKGLDGNPEFSLKFLERKCSDEFGIKQKTEVDHTNRFILICNNGNGDNGNKKLEFVTEPVPAEVVEVVETK